MRLSHSTSLLLGALGALGMAACRQERGGVRADTMPGVRDTVGRVAQGSLDDRQLATLVKQMDGSEIALARAALSRSGNASVRSFADQLQRDHVTMDSLLREIPATGPVPHPPPQFVTLQAASRAKGQLLDALPSGSAYDRAWLAAAASSHRTALDSLQHWRPSARDARLAAALDHAMASVQEHLQRAEALQTALGGGVDGGTTTAPVPTMGTAEMEAAGGKLDRQRADTTSSPPRRAHRPRR